MKGKREVIIPKDIPELIDEVYDRADEKWKEEREKERNSLIAHAKATDDTAPPDGKYKKRNDLMSHAITRYSNIKTVNVLLLPKGDIQNSKEWCADMIYQHSVSIPINIYNDMEKEPVEIEETDVPVWLKDYKIIFDKESYHGENNIFLSS